MELRVLDRTYRLGGVPITEGDASTVVLLFDDHTERRDLQEKLLQSTKLSAMGQLPSANAGWTSGAAMFRPGKILQMGGNSNAATVIDINGPTPIATPTQSMSTMRKWVSATVLPDG